MYTASKTEYKSHQQRYLILLFQKRTKHHDLEYDQDPQSNLSDNYLDLLNAVQLTDRKPLLTPIQR